jgi:Na+(H+)/acetate symporter ActP
VLWAIGLIGSFYLMTLVLGFGAAALVPTGKGSQIQTSAGNAASPLLAQAVGGGEGTVGGSVLLALISAVAFATILAVVAGLTLTSASSVAHDHRNRPNCKAARQVIINSLRSDACPFLITLAYTCSPFRHSG